MYNIQMSDDDVARWITGLPDAHPTRLGIETALSAMDVQRQVIQSCLRDHLLGRTPVPEQEPVPDPAPAVEAPIRKGHGSLIDTVRSGLTTFGPMHIDDICALIERNRMQARGVLLHALKTGRIRRVKENIYALAE